MNGFASISFDRSLRRWPSLDCNVKKSLNNEAIRFISAVMESLIEIVVLIEGTICL